MSDTRMANKNWPVQPKENSKYSVAAASLAVLMDIRDELKFINSRLDCQETLAIPRLLSKIAVNTTRKR